MSGSKVSVVFTKRVEDRDKSGKKVVTRAGTEAELTNAQYKKFKDCVRRVDVKKPVATSTPAPAIPPVTGDGEGGGEGGGTGDDDDTGTGDGASGDD